MQDELLAGFYQMPDSTAKEVAKSAVLNWVDEMYASAPKRVVDLSSERLGYLTATGKRACRITGRVAIVYRVTDRGVQHLRDMGFKCVAQGVPVVDAKPVEVSRASGREALAEIRAKLLGG
jgi:hypothetical protein